MKNELNQLLANLLGCSPKYFTSTGVSIIDFRGNGSNLFNANLGFLAIGTANGVIIQCHQEYNTDFKAIFAEFSKEEFFELNNLSFLERLARKNDFLLSGPYLNLVALKLPDNCQNLHPSDANYRIEQHNDLTRLYKYQDFGNALSYAATDKDEFAIVVKYYNKPIAIATARNIVNNSSTNLYSIGIEVVSDCRRKGMGLWALNSITNAVLKAGYLPVFTASIANIASINLALKANYELVWTTLYTV